VEVAGRPVAYLIIRPRRQSRLRHTADINMGVARSARGQGLGSLVLQAGLERASASSELEILYLMVRSDNMPAIRLYKKMGFEELTVLSRDTKVGDAYFDGLLMRKFVER
jgi:ribosomal protein S18 acetylase RimI-like enzyme